MRWFPVLVVSLSAVLPVSGNPGYFEHPLPSPGLVARGAEVIAFGAAGVAAGLVLAMMARRVRWRTRLVAAALGALVLWLLPPQPDRTGQTGGWLTGASSAAASGKRISFPVRLEPPEWSEKYRRGLDDGWFEATIRRAKDRRYSRLIGPLSKPPAPDLAQLDAAVGRSVAAIRSGQPDVAVDLLAKSFPGKVTPAICMELAGDLDGALESAMKSPAGQVHARILARQLRDRASGGGDASASLIETGPSGASGQGISIQALREYCVQRALLFPAPDLTMARVLRDSAEVLMTDDPAAVHATLELAREYGLPDEVAGTLNRKAEQRIKARLAEEGRSVAGFLIFRWRCWIVAVLGLVAGIALEQRSRVRAARIDQS